MRDGQFDHGQDQAQKSAKANLQLIMANLHHLKKIRNGIKYVKDATKFHGIVKEGGKLTPGQMSYVEGIYEKVWKAANYGGANLHIDKKRKSLGF